ncbi:MAG TPA: nitric-oxide reductase large subunit [Polyangiaceae bacterium]|nr:nitric-oxide reductase large subunit [Polyangiaceae bacterium]
MINLKNRWLLLGLALFAATLVLGFYGRDVYRHAPPIPERIITASGETISTKDGILRGQQVWQRMGGQQVGSIWGHGAYQAPDWSADFLHRQTIALLDEYAQQRFGKAYTALPRSEQAFLEEQVRGELRQNSYDAGTVRYSDARARAIRAVSAHYAALFGSAPSLDSLRANYAMQPNMVASAEDQASLNEFFAWTAWACVTERPGERVTYTNNWPHEPLVGNHPSGENVVWSLVSIVLLLAAIGGIVAYRAFTSHRVAEDPKAPTRDPLDQLRATPSMRAVTKYLLVVTALFLLQVFLGALTAHYTVEGDSFFGIPIAKYLPYVTSRTWHVQLGVFWIATAFLAAGLFLAPVIGGREPRFQRLGVNLLFGALVIVVFGSLAGEWAATHRNLGLDESFWIGRQGYEYVDLGRAWQIALFAGLLLWLGLMVRGVWPALKRPSEMRPLVGLFAGSAAAIGLFYGAGFFYGAKTHLSVMEYWRWWVVHLWVEGFMEVFATAALAFLMAKLGLVAPKHATNATIASTGIFLFGGIPGTFHHLYFSGTPTSIMAVGATFSALEVVPLAVVGWEAFETYRRGHAAQWMQEYRWPIRFFLGVAFWNLVGAGVFGFLINPPISLYYVQGLNTTPVHAHAALFGVYGLLALGLVLFVAKRLYPKPWADGLLALAFWGTNIGLGLMIALSLLPIGLIQAKASVDVGLWYARSAELLQSPLIVTLRWLRLVGDTLFIAGTVSFVLFMIGLFAGWSYRKTSIDREEGSLEVEAPAAAE